MALYRKHIFICTSGPYCWYDCDQGDPDGFLKYLKRRVAEAGLRDAVRVNRSGCLNQCGHGPTLVVYPEGVWYGGVQHADLEEIFQEHILHDRPVTRLQLDLPPGNNKQTEHYPLEVQDFKQTEKELDSRRNAARAQIRLSTGRDGSPS
ncbi:MAG: hypothetical protein KBG20_14690 [Caldilineaceae bacterium]|nr:hypothetical protein [Caldilineaceae bacterium]MBP8107452.1 hypothetical protein [Caldilineaceae bacterium]MBP8122399.1 hypothetical protein [Caldilineaceae bacterium]MBP9073551.1 hypothetical protein [Caldilineaceae bacterium]